MPARDRLWGNAEIPINPFMPRKSKKKERGGGDAMRSRKRVGKTQASLSQLFILERERGWGNNGH